MCPPDHFRIQYEINPWMDRTHPVSHTRAAQQWNDLRALLEKLGAQVSTLDPVEELPDLVFTANAGMVFQNRVVMAHFRHAERQGEVAHTTAWFEGQGWQIETLPEGCYFEGAGDALFCGDTLFAGYRLRSDVGGLQDLGQMLGVRVIPLELVDPYFYHIDTCFCPLDEKTALYYPEALDDYGRRVMEELVCDLIAVTEEEARRLCCNAVVVGRDVVMNGASPRLVEALRARNFQTHATPLDEFLKAGGSAKCLTLRLDGEEAASWKRSE